MANLTQYSEHERAKALAVVAACGGKVAEAARRVGVPRRTLQRWKGEADNRDLQAAARQGVANAKAPEWPNGLQRLEVAKPALGDGCERLSVRSGLSARTRVI
jgi:transposase-like protein